MMHQLTWGHRYETRVEAYQRVNMWQLSQAMDMVAGDCDDSEMRVSVSISRPPFCPLIYIDLETSGVLSKCW
jgi:hypothetical protein